MDTFAQFKQAQKEGWKHFAPLEMFTTPAAAKLVRFAHIEKGDRMLDVGCGTGVVAITAARQGAQVTAADLTPELLARAMENGKIAGVSVEWHEADVEQLPFPNGAFDVVVSQFAHMFAPRPDVAIAEMLRVLRPGGTIAFATWPPELLVGRTMALSAKYMPPPPPGVSPPVVWGETNFVRQKLADKVTDIVFDRDGMMLPALTPAHFRMHVERSAGPMIHLVEMLSATNPDKLAEFRSDFDAIVEQYHRDNMVRQDYLMTRGRKV